MESKGLTTVRLDNQTRVQHRAVSSGEIGQGLLKEIRIGDDQSHRTTIFNLRRFSGLTRLLWPEMWWTRAAKSSWFSRVIKRPAFVRQFSSQGSPASKKSSQLLLFTSLTAGLVGFTVAKSLPTNPTTESHHATQFGSSDDFKKAIQELKSTFSADDKVSTDPDVLHVHGFSTNDYHPGMCLCRRTLGTMS